MKIHEAFAVRNICGSSRVKDRYFFMCKRLYAHLLSDENGNDANAYEAREERYVLPLPSGEIANR